MPDRGGVPLVGKTLYARAVLMDTGAFLALANTRDSNHAPALTCLKAIAGNRLPVFVSAPTIYESHRRFLFDFGQEASTKFLEEIYDGSATIVRTTESDEIEARRLIQRYQALALTFTDAVNMAIMTRLQIGASFSFDRHYLQAGFIRIPRFICKVSAAVRAKAPIAANGYHRHPGGRFLRSNFR